MASTKQYIVYMSIITSFVLIHQLWLALNLFTNTNDDKSEVLKSRIKDENQINIEETPSIVADGHATAGKQYYKNHTNSEVQHFAFLEVHQAGSSTIQNILYRFGLPRSLTFVLPTDEHILSRSRNHDFRTVLPLPCDTDQSGKYDILCNHAVFKIDKLKKVMHTDAEYFAIVRKPLDLSTPATYYYRYMWFDESLVLLKRHFEWSIEDIIYLKSSVYHGNATGISVSNLTASNLIAFNRSQWVDVNLYEHFLERFLEQVKQEVDFDKEVQCFKKYLSIVQTFCSSSVERERDYVVLPKTQFSESFTVSKEECWLMKLEKKALFQKLKIWHWDMCLHLIKCPLPESR